MPQTGSLAANLHEGSRSEYLAQYALSALGMAALLPRQEDVGIDLQCALGERIGQRLSIRNYYLAQVKSTDDFGSYEGQDSVKWLCAHRYPLIFVHVKKRTGDIAIYQTAELVQITHLNALRVTLQPGGPAPSFSARHGSEEEVVLTLGPPILAFSVANIGDDGWRTHARQILRFWIELDQANIDKRVRGMVSFEFPESYQINAMPVGRTAALNFKHANVTDNLLDALAIRVSVAAADGDHQAFGQIIDFVAHYVIPQFQADTGSSTMRHLVIAVNTAAKKLGHRGRLVIHLPDGTPCVLEADIES
jgi:hypothetical protein